MHFKTSSSSSCPALARLLSTLHRKTRVSLVKPKSGQGHYSGQNPNRFPSFNRYGVLNVNYGGFCGLPFTCLFLASYAQPPWPLCCSLKFLPQGLCTCCAHCLECFSLTFTFFKSLLKVTFPGSSSLVTQSASLTSTFHALFLLNFSPKHLPLIYYIFYLPVVQFFSTPTRK